VAYSPAPLQQWWPRWDKPQLPQAIRIEMAPLKARSTEVELQPVTAPLHVTRNPMVVYGQYR
jgi:hypothetical protein